MRRVLPLFCCLFVHAVTFAQKDCRHTEYEERILSANPDMSRKLEALEQFTQNRISDRRTAMTSTSTGNSSSLPDIITIPVVVHILYNTAGQNISDKQVLSQLEVLNKDYRNLNSDRTKVPSYFADLVADCGFEFKLAQVDPKGAPTSGIIRRKTSIQYFGMDDRAKYSSKGGDDAWDAGKYLNIWVCNLTGGLIGYSSLMGCSPEVDGVVILSSVFGTSSNADFGKGRTATHEIGHWLNLRHIWGDASCGDDKVDDTPAQRSPNRGCPSGKIFTCGTTENGDMYMNYMDLTNDGCMYMFTNGQRERMRAVFQPGGPRNSILSNSTTLTSPSSSQAAPLSGGEDVIITTGLQVYPNPATTSITVQIGITKIVAGRAFVIYNHTGQPMQSFIATGGQTNVDISRLVNGMYYIKAKDGEVTMMSKFVKIN